ncbi:type II toxin-antitoxin system RelE family toxin, partial [Salmonella enterica]|uniref:type II toxin-antitoxin system RelE family toxin n=1 Tax=Salmonella enterica TaxID=28901 RepID=UPI00349F4C4A
MVSFLADRVAQDDNPRRTGTALQGSEIGNFWRYRVGDYRIICDIQDHKLVVLEFNSPGQDRASLLPEYRCAHCLRYAAASPLRR